METKDYDIAVSFAGEDRPFVERVVHMLGDAGVSVFYDRDEQARLWGMDLVEELQVIYSRGAFRVLLFISEHSVAKKWPRHERRAAQSRMIEEEGSYILPVRLDDTPVPGLNPSVSFVTADRRNPAHLVEMVLAHLTTAGRRLGSQPDEIRLRSEEARKVSLSSLAIQREEATDVEYEITNGGAFQIGNVVLVFDDPFEEGDPTYQNGTALEIVFGTLGPGATKAGRAKLRLQEEPPFSRLTRLGYLLFTDTWGQHWVTNGGETWRTDHAARMC